MTQTAKHAQGGWHVLEDCTENGFFVGNDETQKVFATSPNGLTIETARLIAAAPDMAEALAALLDQADERYPHFEDTRGTANREKARAALAKAGVK